MADNRPRNGSSRDLPCVLYCPTGEDVCGLVVLFIPRLVQFVTQAEVERQPWSSLVVILKITSGAPLPVAHLAERIRKRGGENAAKNKICRAVSSAIGRI